MGMFDYVAIESDAFDEFNIAPSPRENPTCQTKSFGCWMGTYIIKDRELFYWQREWRTTDEISHTFQLSKDSDPWVVYKKELISERDEKVPFHGIMRLGVHMDGKWQYLYPKFTDGILVEVLTEEPGFPDNGFEF